MLYATTRSKVETYTAQRALKEERAPDGGLYIPVQVPAFADSEIMSLRERVPSDVMADVMNRFWGAKLSRWDVEFHLGRDLFGLTDMNHRIVVGELWKSGLGNMESILTELVSLEEGITKPGAWMRVTVRIGLLFAIFGELERRGSVSRRKPLDVAVMTGDFVTPFAAWYARKMGLPIGTIVCCCNENGGLWDLLNRGQFKLGEKVIATTTPDCDMVSPWGLEWLMYMMDRERLSEYLEAQEKGRLYELTREQQSRIRSGLYVSVTSDQRLSAVMPNVYRTNGYVLCPYSAMVYAGLMDYRSVTGERRLALMLLERSPLDSAAVVTRALGIQEDELTEKL